MSWLENLVYGLFSGFSEFAPVSSRGHQSVLLKMFGSEFRDPVQDLVIHLFSLLAVLVSCHQLLSKLNYELRVSRRYSKTRSAKGTMRSTYDLKLIRTAAIPMLIGLLLYSSFSHMEGQSMLIVGLWILYGIVLFVTDHRRQGNKDARTMSGMDAFFMGVAGALRIFPGIADSSMVYAINRGAHKEHAVNWALLLSIPALAMLSILDIFAIFGGFVPAFSLSLFLGYLFSALGAFAGGYFGVLLLRMIVTRSGLSGFAFYCWGAAMFTFFLYLII